METNRNPLGLIIGAIICIVIGIGSFQIAYDTYKEIKSKFSLDLQLDRITPGDRHYNWDHNYKTDWWRDSWYKTRTREESNKYAILYASSFIFSMSLCCFTE